MALLSVFLEILQRPRISDVFVEFVRFIAPLFVAVVVGVLFGWAWKPKWARWGREMAVSSTFKSSIADLISLKMPFTGYITWFSDDNGYKDSSSLPHGVVSPSSSSKVETQKPALVNEEDLQHLCRLVEVKDGGPDWIQMMDRSTPTMGYQAWRRDPESGPPQYRSRTVFEDATPELVRDFFWDDEFRSKWDDMLVHASTLEDCTSTGTMVVHWVRKFPFFCSDREYVIGRRIWESQRRYYCVTKGVPNSVPRRNKPRRVDLYYSSWCIRAVESRRGDGQLTACEVILFHHEDMGIPWEIAKIGVRQGMWRAVKKIEPGLRAFQKARTTAAAPLSRCCLLARINTRVGEDYLHNLKNDENESSSERELSNPSENYLGRSIPKLLVVGGAVLLACSLDKGLLTKAVIFGVGRRFAKIGKRLPNV